MEFDLSGEADEEIRDHMFRYELGGSGPLAALADNVAKSVLDYEAKKGLRKRQRRNGDAASFQSAIHIIVANLAHYTLFPPGQGRLTLPLGHRTAPSVGKAVRGFGKTLPALLGTLEALAVLTVRKPEGARSFVREAATIAPTSAFVREVGARGISGRHFTRSEAAPVVVLTKRDQWGYRVPQRVPNNEVTRAMNAQVRSFNAHLAAADLDYVGTETVDINDRRLVRRFVLPRDYDQVHLVFSGRLFGGYWQRLKRAERPFLRINGEPVVELDYGQIFPRLAYAHVRAVPPTGNIYDLPGTEQFTDEQRQAIKWAFNAFLFKSTTMRRWHPDIAAALPEGWTVGRFKRALLKGHPSLRPALNKGIGYRLMNRESEILCGVLARCLDAFTPLLPLHDAVLCPASRKEAVTAVMVEEARRVSRVHIPVAVKDHE